MGLSLHFDQSHLNRHAMFFCKTRKSDFQKYMFLVALDGWEERAVSRMCIRFTDQVHHGMAKTIFFIVFLEEILPISLLSTL